MSSIIHSSEIMLTEVLDMRTGRVFQDYQISRVMLPTAPDGIIITITPASASRSLVMAHQAFRLFLRWQSFRAQKC